jgi:hypothetical protein
LNIDAWRMRNIFTTQTHNPLDSCTVSVHHPTNYKQQEAFGRGMATLIPAMGTCVSRMTSGERRLAERLQQKLDDD